VSVNGYRNVEGAQSRRPKSLTFRSASRSARNNTRMYAHQNG
jgi:hypothetical protein